MRFLRLIIIYLALIGLTACTSDSVFDASEFVAKEDDTGDILEIALQIHNEVGDASAQHLSMCDTIPIGAKPCGGPWFHLVFSIEESDKKLLEELAAVYTELDHKRNVEEGRGSTCDISGIPELKLKDGKCYGEGSYAWNPGNILKFNGIEND